MRVIKIIEASPKVASAYAKKAFCRKCLRVVECEPQQRGYLSEKGVRLLWESDHYDSRSRGPKSNYRTFRALAEEVATRERARLAAEVGLVPETPECIIADAREEAGL